MDEQISFSSEVTKALDDALKIARSQRHEFVMPEHLLLALLEQNRFDSALSAADGRVDDLRSRLHLYLEDLEKVPSNIHCDPQPSRLLNILFDQARKAVIFSGRDCIEVPHAAKALLSLSESYAGHALDSAIHHQEGSFMSGLVMNYDMTSGILHSQSLSPSSNSPVASPLDDGDDWHNLVCCVNDTLDGRNPLVGREAEIEQTIRVLCRKDKNNPLHVGEPGVGKTALVIGLARMIEKGKVPQRLKGSKIYQLDMGSLLAGTQFRGDMERRIKMIMDGAANEKGAIIYIDEIHNMVGAGATGESSMDASNMLKPYLEAGEIRFIGSTTYDEYKRHFAKSKGIVRRFTQIDVPEPSIDETINILRQLKRGYENFHGVHYLDNALEFAVNGSARHINDRFLPDKAIDLIDEAGAYRQIHPLKQKRQSVDKSLIAEILAKHCKVDSLAIKEEDSVSLSTLSDRMKSLIFGQDEAVKQVTEAVQMSKAGLSDENKPMASLLFVGPTGVGKTEVARVLAKELGIELVRFDMSEYTEKHTVAKLIGSPAGYVGYDDGGLLTDAIRKTPNCVLLLDEIEKAHPDIYNILLQVMDYARLTDSKGNRADFRNVVLIMTSNAGAQFASQAKVGFGSAVSSGEAMMRQVKKTFKPEFLNRLSGTVIFRDMTREMASLILDKNLARLQRQLDAKGVRLNLSADAREYILDEGFSPEYGARELERVIASKLKPLLMREILFGSLKKGGEATIGLSGGSVCLM